MKLVIPWLFSKAGDVFILVCVVMGGEVVPYMYYFCVKHFMQFYILNSKSKI